MWRKLNMASPEAFRSWTEEFTAERDSVHYLYELVHNAVILWTDVGALICFIYSDTAFKMVDDVSHSNETDIS